MSRRNRERKIARREPFREAKPVVLVICEGGTEKEYLDGFVEANKNSRVKVEVKGHEGVPKTVVQIAKKRMKENQKQARREKDDNLRFDAIWGLFDVDEHPNIPDAVQMARDNGIRLAISNPCFELWLYLHFANQPGMQNRHAILGQLKAFIPTYDKRIEYADFASGYEQAVSRAAQLENQSELDGEAGRNPSTGVWRLTEDITTDDVT
ncbi:MAG: RloB family protein [Pirellulaceae bacterium]|nr:RloB family protein [Pirellulaceae bacterium]